jgi:hypothetical protein
MNEKREARVIDQELHYRNRDRFTIDDLRPYAGELLAWSFEGDRIVAHSRDPMEVVRQLDEQGLHPEEIVLEQMPPADRFDEEFDA